MNCDNIPLDHHDTLLQVLICFHHFFWWETNTWLWCRFQLWLTISGPSSSQFWAFDPSYMKGVLILLNPTDTLFVLPLELYKIDASYLFLVPSISQSYFFQIPLWVLDPYRSIESIGPWVDFRQFWECRACDPLISYASMVMCRRPACMLNQHCDANGF